MVNPDQQSDQCLSDPAFQSVLVSCLEKLERGERLDRDELLAAHAHHADVLDRFLADQAMLKRVASQVRDSLSGHLPGNKRQVPIEETIDSNPRPHDVAVGEQIRYVGEYEIVEEIARGGMGVVFKARQRKLNRTVALKMILAGKLADDADVQRFYREARAAGRLKHPHIVPVHEIGEHEGRHYFTMDYVEGHSLAEEVRESSLPPRRSAKLVRTAAEAVHFAHEQGTVHRDLKPANLLVTADGVPHITDFGLAKILESVDEESRAELTASGQILGTPSYMSPEQASGRQELVGPASDIYSLGAILYACLTGRAPFVADSPVDTLIQVMKKEPVAIRELNPSAPKDLETICLKCLTKEPHKRYGTAQELADELNRFLEGRPVVARPVGPISKTMRWCRRNKAVAALLCLLFLSMAIGTYVSASYAITAVRLAQDEARARAHAETAKEQAEGFRRQAEQAQHDAEEQRDHAKEARRVAEQRGADLRRQLYIAQMPRALEAWNDGNTAGVREILTQHIPGEDEEDLRGFEWHFLKGLTESSRLTIDAGRRIVGVEISPDGRVIATVGAKTLVLHSLDDGAKMAEFSAPGHGGIAGVAFDSTSSYLCVASHRVRLWDLTENRPVWDLDGLSGCDWCAFTPDDSLIVSTGNEWKTRTAQVQIRAVDSGKLVHTISVPKLVWSAALDRFGRSIYAACQDRMLRQWDLSSGTLLREWPCSSVAFAMSWDPTGRFLLIGNGDGLLERHDVIDGKRTDEWGGRRNSFQALAVDEAGSRFVAVGRSQLVHFFDAKTGETVEEFRGHSEEIMDVKYRPGFHEVVTTDRSGVIHVWNTRSRQGGLSVDGELIDVAAADFSPDGRWFVYSEGIPWAEDRKGTVRLFDLEQQMPGPTLDGHEQGVFGLAVSDQMIYSASADGQLIAWDAITFERRWSRAFGKPLGSLAVSSDGKILVVGTRDGAILVLDDPQADPATEFQVSGNHKEFQSIAISPDGRLVAAASRDHLKVLDRRRNTTVLDTRLKLIRTIAFDPMGEWLASGNDGHVVIYDTLTWQVVYEIKADSQPIAGIAFHPQLRQLATRSIGGSLKLWDSKTWQNVLTLPLLDGSQHDQHDPRFSPDGCYLVANRQSRQVRLLCTKRPSLGPQPLDADALSQRAHHFIAQQKWPEAFDYFERAIAAGSENLADHLNGAQVAAMMDQNDETRHRIHESVRLAEKIADEDLDRAARLVQAAQLIADADPSPETSLQIARQAWERHGGNTSYALAYTLFRQRRDAELVEFMEANRARLKPSATFPLLHSAALYRLGRVDEANYWFNRAADRYGNQMPPIGRGRILEWEEFSGFIWDLLTIREVSDIALEALNKATAERPDDAGLLAYRGLLHRRWHCWSDALTDLQRAHELDAENADYLEAATVCATLAGQFEIADQLATKYVDRFRGPEGIQQIWSAARIATLNPDASCIDENLLQDVRRSVQAEPRQSWRHLALIGCLYRLGHFDQALGELDAFDQANPKLNGLNSSLRRGLILLDKGDVDGAAKALAVATYISWRAAQPPSVFPRVGKHAFADEMMLQKELSTRLANINATQSRENAKDEVSEVEKVDSD